MRIPLLLFLAITAQVLSACRSGTVETRGDYQGQAFDPLKQRIADRAKVLRNLHPELSEADALAKASKEFDYERGQEQRRMRQKEARDKFEQELAKSVER